MADSTARGGGRLSPSPVPLYHRIYVTLSDRIQSGQIGKGDFLPGEVALAKEFGVSRITIKRALNELKAARLVVRQRGRGTRVVHDLAAPSIPASVAGWLQNISLLATGTEVRLHEFAYVQASREIADALQIEVGQTVQQSVRTRQYKGCTFSHLTTHLPEAIGRTFTREELARRPLLHLLERAGYRVSSARQIVTATLADPVVAQVLSIEIGAPLLEMRRVVFDAARRPIEYIRVLYRPDYYRYEMDLVRMDEGDGMRWATGAQGRDGISVPTRPQQEGEPR